MDTLTDTALPLLDAIWPFIALGIVAQLVDGALGMAFGVITNTVLVSVLGMAPARASASVHVVEAFTTCASGLSHILHGNVDWKLLARLAVPGVAGGVLGAYVLSSIDGAVARPYVMAYLALIGLYLLARALRWRPMAPRCGLRFAPPLGLVGGFLDAAGGGGWGPIVTSNLLAQGGEPRRVIGTVNTAEFFVTVAVSLSFMLAIGIEAFSTAAVGLILGGLLAAPFGALLAKKIPPRTLLFLVSVLLIATSSFSLYRALA